MNEFMICFTALLITTLLILSLMPRFSYFDYSIIHENLLRVISAPLNRVTFMLYVPRGVTILFKNHKVIINSHVGKLHGVIHEDFNGTHTIITYSFKFNNTVMLSSGIYFITLIHRLGRVTIIVNGVFHE